MNLNKLRIMQQIQIALIEKGLSADVIENCGHFVLQAWIRKGVVVKDVDSVWSHSAEETELQLWHDTIVYGPQVSKED